MVGNFCTAKLIGVTVQELCGFAVASFLLEAVDILRKDLDDGVVGVLLSNYMMEGSWFGAIGLTRKLSPELDKAVEALAITKSLDSEVCFVVLLHRKVLALVDGEGRDLSGD